MDIKTAAKQLFDEGFLLGGRRRRKALAYLRERGNSEAVSILADAVDRDHPKREAIARYLNGITDPAAIDAMVNLWAQKRQDWLTPIVVERALVCGRASALPMDREIAMRVAEYASRQDMAGVVSEYGKRVLRDKPKFQLRFILKVGWGSRLEADVRILHGVVKLLKDSDKAVSSAAEAYLQAAPDKPEFNSVIVDAWIQTESPQLDAIVKEPRLPSEPDKVALVQLVRGDIAGYHKLNDAGGVHLAGALAMATADMRRAINAVVLDSRDATLADAYRQASAAGGEGADSRQAIQALIASGNEDGLVEAVRTMTLSEVLPLVKHWADTDRRPRNPDYLKYVERAVAAQKATPDLAIEPARNLPDELEDIADVWRDRPPKDLDAKDPVERAGALFDGWRKGRLDQNTLREKAGSPHWPERLVAALAGHGPSAEKPDHVMWINTVAGLDGDLMARPIQCGPEERQQSDELRRQLAQAPGAMAKHNWALCETLCAFRELYGGQIVLGEDDSPDRPDAIHASAEEAPIDAFDD